MAYFGHVFRFPLVRSSANFAKKNENLVKIGGVWGGVAPPARAGENMAKVSQEAGKTIQKSPKIEP